MPRYYFHYQDGISRRADAEGMNLPDEEAAWYQAVRQARDILGETIRPRLDPAHCVEIEDERGEPVLALLLDEVAAFAV